MSYSASPKWCVPNTTDQGQSAKWPEHTTRCSDHYVNEPAGRQHTGQTPLGAEHTAQQVFIHLNANEYAKTPRKALQN